MAEAIKVSDIMKGKEPNPSYEGIVTNDDICFAIDTTGMAVSENDYQVVQVGVTGLDASLNAISVDKQYIRAGQSSTKTGSQRTISMTGDRFVGDPVQDYIFSNKIIYGVGEAVVVPYVLFNMLTGKGEKGKCSIIVNSDGSGTAGNSAEVSVDFKKIGNVPQDYTYAPA